MLISTVGPFLRWGDAAVAAAIDAGAGRTRWVLSVGGTEHLTLPQLFPQLQRVDVGLGLLGGVSPFVPAASAVISAGMRVGPLARGIRSVVARTSPGSSGGPIESDRAAGSSVVIAEAMAPDGTCLHRTELRGIEGFTFTAQFLAWAAAQAANGEITGAGALGPVQAFGLDALTEGVARSGIALESAG